MIRYQFLLFVSGGVLRNKKLIGTIYHGSFSFGCVFFLHVCMGNLIWTKIKKGSCEPQGSSVTLWIRDNIFIFLTAISSYMIYGITLNYRAHKCAFPYSLTSFLPGNMPILIVNRYGFSNKKRKEKNANISENEL